MSKKDVILLDFEGVYLSQPTLFKSVTHIDLRHLRSVKYMCDLNTLNRVAELIEQRPRIVFLGDSAYHHFSYIFLRSIHSSFELVVFDNHRDDAHKDSNLITCDSWIEFAKKLENLKAVHFVRKKKDLPKHFEHPIYASIDKDVLSEKFLKLGWDQGNMQIEELLEAVKFLLEKREVLGVDISGEPRDPFQMQRSEEVNLALLKLFMTRGRSLRKRKIKSSSLLYHHVLRNSH